MQMNYQRHSPLWSNSVYSANWLTTLGLMGTGTLSSASLFLWLLVRFLFFILLPGRSTCAVTVSVICLMLSEPLTSSLHRLVRSGKVPAVNKCQRSGTATKVNKKGGVGHRPWWRGWGSCGVECRPTWTWITEVVWRCLPWLSGWEGVIVDLA